VSLVSLVMTFNLGIIVERPGDIETGTVNYLIGSTNGYPDD
jgi:hypothetical protein